MRKAALHIVPYRHAFHDSSQIYYLLNQIQTYNGRSLKDLLYHKKTSKSWVFFEQVMHEIEARRAIAMSSKTCSGIGELALHLTQHLQEVSSYSSLTVDSLSHR